MDAFTRLLREFAADSMALSARPFFLVANEKVKHMGIHPALLPAFESRIDISKTGFDYEVLAKFDAEAAAMAKELSSKKFAKPTLAAYFINYVLIMLKVNQHSKLVQQREEQCKEWGIWYRGFCSRSLIIPWQKAPSF